MHYLTIPYHACTAVGMGRLQWSQHGYGARAGGSYLHLAADLLLTSVSFLLLICRAAQARIGLHFAGADATRVWQQNAIRQAPERAGWPVHKRDPPQLQATQRMACQILLPYTSATKEHDVAAVLARRTLIDLPHHLPE